MRSSKKVRGAAAWAAVVVLAGCGGGGGQPSGSASASESKSSTEAASPSTATVDLEATVPRGEYKLRANLVDLKPKGAPGWGKIERYTWKFYPPTCDDTHCTGKTRSSSGAVYSYDWDGAALRMKRESNPGEGRATCANGRGSFRYAYHQVLDDFVPSQTPTSAPPTQLTGQDHWTVTYAKVKDCPVKDRAGLSADYTMTLTKKG